MVSLHEHFALLDSDRERDDVGPWLPLLVVPPWHDTAAWHPPRIRRYKDGFELAAAIAGEDLQRRADPPRRRLVVGAEPDAEPGDPLPVYARREKRRHLQPDRAGLAAGGATRVWPEIELGRGGVTALGVIHTFMHPNEED